jgi:hypothetical protein
MRAGTSAFLIGERVGLRKRAIPVAVLTSRRDVGLAARRIGVFMTLEEARSTKT